jgi:ATP-binding cassette subfamily F protein uup
MFAQPANMLVLDEPTNDLDTETLELLEEILTDFSGTVLVVSHDREFLNNLVTATLVFEGRRGEIKEYVGGYDDWERLKAEQRKLDVPKPISKATSHEAAKLENPGVKKLSFKEKLELESLPSTIESLEKERDLLHSKMGDHEWFSKPGFVSEAKARLAAIEEEHDTAYKRWEALEERPG